MKLLACPICGKYPKIDDRIVYAKAECRPKLGNPHLIVYGTDVLDVVSEWEKAVQEYWKDSQKKGRKEQAGG